MKNDKTDIMVGLQIKKIHIDHAMKTFYSLFFIADYLPKKYRTRYLEVREEFETRFAQALYDYLTIAVAGEMRHSENQTNDGKFLKCPWEDEGRTVAYVKALNYDPNSILKCAKRAFCELNWNKSFGGQRWCEIATTTAKYKTVPDSIYIDWVLHVRHNGNSMFDREFLFTTETSGFRDFLDWRHDATPRQWTRLYLPLELYTLFEGEPTEEDLYSPLFDNRITEQEFLNTRSCTTTEAPFGVPIMGGAREMIPKIVWVNLSSLFQYRPVSWGKKKCTLEEHHRDHWEIPDEEREERIIP